VPLEAEEGLVAEKLFWLERLMFEKGLVFEEVMMGGAHRNNGGGDECVSCGFELEAGVCVCVGKAVRNTFSVGAAAK